MEYDGAAAALSGRRASSQPPGNRGRRSVTTILTLNAGSSSIKFAAYRAIADEVPNLALLQQGQLAEVGSAPRLLVRDASGSALVDQHFTAAEIPDIPAAEVVINDWIVRRVGAAPDAIGHRVVHGGSRFTASVRVDAGVFDQLLALTPLAPLHQPYNLELIRMLLRRWPQIPQFACFDTAFHHGHRAEVDLYALPQALIRDGIRRYGFHGLSYEYIASRLAEIDPALHRGRLVVAHLGNGASLCALKGGRSVDSTMGFSALEGLVMGTRPGNLDPGVILYLMQQRGMDVAQINHLLYHECGLKGLSGTTGDMRELLAQGTPAARLAVDVFVHRIAQGVAAMATSMSGIDGLVFTAGIGEHAAAVRAAVVARLGLFGAEIDESANATHQSDIGGRGSRIALRVVPTDEERMIARHVVQLLQP